jgi:hypothetical protein
MSMEDDVMRSTQVVALINQIEKDLMAKNKITDPAVFYAQYERRMARRTDLTFNGVQEAAGVYIVNMVPGPNNVFALVNPGSYEGAAFIGYNAISSGFNLNGLRIIYDDAPVRQPNGFVVAGGMTTQYIPPDPWGTVGACNFQLVVDLIANQAAVRDEPMFMLWKRCGGAQAPASPA